METVTKHPFIVTDQHKSGGEPIIVNTKTTVRAIVELWRLGIHPEEITNHLPHLTLAQIFDALSYYSENQDQINHYILENHIPDELVHPSVRHLK